MIPEEALIEAAHEMQLVSGCYVSLEDYAAGVTVLLRELARNGFVFYRSATCPHPEDSTNHLLSIESASHVALTARRQREKLSV
jgi:hypothetical protein